jgi:hypothetical protein
VDRFGGSLGLHLATYVIVTMMTVMGGRVIPSFTDNKLRTRARRWPLIETTGGAVHPRRADRRSGRALLIVTALLAAIGRGRAWHPPGRLVHQQILVGAAAVDPAPGLRLDCVGFALLALSAAGIGAAAGSALHAFTAGGIGVLTLGMMARVSLGHSGRMLEPAPLMTWAFVAVNLAALIRVASAAVVSRPVRVRHGHRRRAVDRSRSACSPRSTRPSCCVRGSTANPVEPETADDRPLRSHPYLRTRHARAARRARAQDRARRRLHLPQSRRQQGHRRLHFCNNKSFAPGARDPAPMAAQFDRARGRIAHGTGARRFIAYFQAYTNTYAHVDELRALYDAALAEPDVIGLSIGTRP